MSSQDPFDQPFEEDVVRGPGRPRTRDIRERGAVGRPRIRPIDSPSSRRRGRPTVSPSDIADQISKEAIISGQITAKSINASVQGLSTSVQQFQKGVINPLSKVVSNFSQSVARFNSQHQEYLKQQIMMSREIHETFKYFRKSTIDPLLRTSAQTRVGIHNIAEVMKEINKERYQGKDYELMINQLSSIDRKMQRTIAAGTAATAASDMFLREYYKSSKGTSKFLNSVQYAAEDMAEDIQALKADLSKYFRGKNTSQTVLQDQTETLRKIEDNTKGLKFVIATQLVAGIAALAKTAFTFNRYGTVDVLTNLFGKSKGFSNKALNYGPLSGIFSKFGQSRGAQKARTAYQEASLGGYGDFAQTAAETVGRAGRRTRQAFSDLKGLGKSIADAWNESKVKWFWDIGWKMFSDKWDRQGAVGVSIVSRQISNYEKGKSPTSGGKTVWGTQEAAISGLQRAIQKFNKSKSRLNDVGEWESENEAAVAFSPDQMRTLRYNRPSGSNVIQGNFGKKSNVVHGRFGKSDLSAPERVTINPDSNNKMTSAETGTVHKALASLNRINLRILGYLQRIFKHTKSLDDQIDDLEGGKKEKISDKSGLAKLLGGAALALGGRKALVKFAAARAGWRGAAVGLGSKAKFARAGATGRVLWDTFGFGNAKKGTRALGIFKNTKLGQSRLGRFIRTARVANAGFGTNAEMRLLRGGLSATRWGGIFDPLGAAIGFGRAAGNARQATGLLGATGKSMGALGTAGLMMDRAGAAVVGAGKAVGGVVSKGATKAGNWLGNIGKMSNLGKVGGGLAKAAGMGGLLGGLGKAAGLFLKKVPVIGGLFTLGLGIKELVKDHDWKNGLWHILTGILMAVPVTSLAGSILAIGGDAVKFGVNKYKNKKAQKEMNLSKGAETAIKGVAGESPIVNKALKAKGVNLDAINVGDDINGYSGVSRTSSRYSPKKAQAIERQLAAQGESRNTYSFWGRLTGADKADGSSQMNSAYVNPDGKAEKSPFINWNGNDKSGLIPEFSQKLAAAAEKYYKATGKKLKITSGTRSNRKQAELYARRKAAGDNSISNNVARPAVSDVVSWKGKKYWVRGKDDGNVMRTGHMAGGAVDVVDHATFLPYARSVGLQWGGDWDPTDRMHFQINKKAPVVGSASPVKTPPPDAIKVGDSSTTGVGPSIGGPTIISGPSSTAAPNPTPQNSEPEISPIIQDYGLAIINNLLFI